MGKLFRLAIGVLTIVLAAAHTSAAAETGAAQPTATVPLPSVPTTTASPLASPTPLVSQTPAIDHVFYGRPAHATPGALPVSAGSAPPTAQAVGTATAAPAISSPAQPPTPSVPTPAVAIAKPAPKGGGHSHTSNALGPHSIDHYFYGLPPGASSVIATPAVATPTATPAPAAASTPVAAIIPPAPPAVATPTPVGSATPVAPARLSDEGLRLYLSDPVSATSSSFNWTVTAYKSRHRIDVSYKRHLYHSYHAVFGRSRFAGPKQWEGDRRTPEGNYLIVSRHRSVRFRWFLKINYPNAIDRTNFLHAKAYGDIPHGMHEGDGVGIHGTDLPILNLGNIDWTTGCISIDNADISELARLLPIGTLVTIKP